MHASLPALVVSLVIAGPAWLRDVDPPRPLARPSAVAGSVIEADVPIRGPQIDVRAPAEMAPQAERLARFNTARLVAVMRLVGLEDAGPPIPVLLAPEDGLLARQTPGWVAGFATGSEVVLFPARAPSYPHESLGELLQHEVAHVLIGRAAGGRPVPRWFHEGVALAAERVWSLGDRANFALDVAFGGTIPASSLGRLFEAGPGAAARAYRLSGMLVQDLRRVHGPDLPARVLEGTRGGLTFDAAFHASTGVSVDEATDAFWHRRRLWVTWLPWLTSSAALWALVTLLALAAFAAVRWRRARRRWDDEEAG